MKKLLFFLFVLCAFQLRAEIGCMDNSYHTKELFDSKTYHYVQCNCKCWKHRKTARGKCTNCRHYHTPRKLEILKFEGFVMKTRKS